MTDVSQSGPEPAQPTVEQQTVQEQQPAQEQPKPADNQPVDAQPVNEQPVDEQPVTKADFSLMNKFIRSTLLNSTHDVEIIRSDPNNPLYSVKTFEELKLDETLLKGVYDMGFSKPSKIQETALPLLINERKNLIAQSQSGTGKTAAFLLASLSRVDVTQKYPQVIILSPTYELAVQTYEVARRMAKFNSEITFRLVTKGQPVSNHAWTETVLIGTPGRMVDSTLKYKNANMSKIKVYVLDEADVMIDTQGHKAQSMRMRRALPPDCQILLFSATYDDEIRRFASDIAPNAVEIHLKREEQSLANIQQFYIVTRTEEDKYRALANIFGTISIGQTFIFCQTKKSASYLTQKLSNDGHQVSMISGDLTVEQRTQALLDFKEGRQRVMISTNLMARGIDIDQVTVVVNYDLPVDKGRIDKETYLHRIGRTGRFGKDGLAINMISTLDEKRMIDELEVHFGQPIKELDPNNIEELEKLEQS
uniref:RNA helicase n=1 Tax=Aceria tosichella TaxID=561515 RepID=A0A6G1S530_9ACAR